MAIALNNMTTLSQTHRHTPLELRINRGATVAALDTNTLTYGLNINSVVACIGVLPVRVSVEALKVLTLLGVSRDPVGVTVHCDGLEKGMLLPRVESFLQEMSFFLCVLTVKFCQVLVIRHQCCS